MTSAADKMPTGHIRYHKIPSYDNGPKYKKLLEGEAVVGEKIDGANLSVWSEDGVPHIGSRNHAVNQYPDRFKDAKEWLTKADNYNQALRDLPDHRFFGEWLKKNKIVYDPASMGEFYLFDIMIGDKYQPFDYVQEIAQKYGFLTPKVWLRGHLTEKDIRGVFMKSALGAETAEGVVIRSLTPEKFDYPIVKMVTNEFKESHKKAFGLDPEESSYEKCVAFRHSTKARVRKAIYHFRNKGERISRRLTGKIIRYTYDDFVSEEILNFSKNRTIDFGLLNREATDCIRNIFFALLSGEDFNASETTEEIVPERTATDRDIQAAIDAGIDPNTLESTNE